MIGGERVFQVCFFKGLEVGGGGRIQVEKLDSFGSGWGMLYGGRGWGVQDGVIGLQMELFIVLVLGIILVWRVKGSLCCR